MCSSSPRIDPPVIQPTAPRPVERRETPRVVTVNPSQEVEERKIRRHKNGSLLRSLKIPLNTPE